MRYLRGFYFTLMLTDAILSMAAWGHGSGVLGDDLSVSRITSQDDTQGNDAGSRRLSGWNTPYQRGYRHREQVRNLSMPNFGRDDQ